MNETAMNDINFGIDFLHTLVTTEHLCQRRMKNVVAFGGFLLALEWGFSIQESNVAADQLIARRQNNLLDDPNKVIGRLIGQVKDDAEARAKLLTDIIMLTLLDPDTKEEKAMNFVFDLGDALGFEPMEVGKLASRATNLLTAFDQLDQQMREIFSQSI